MVETRNSENANDKRESVANHTFSGTENPDTDPFEVDLESTVAYEVLGGFLRRPSLRRVCFSYASMFRKFLPSLHEPGET